MTKVVFIVSITMLLLFIVQVGGLWGTSIIGVDPEFEPPTSTVEAFFDNFGFFFELMTASSEFLIFGSVILLAWIIGIAWAVAELLRGV